MLMTALLAAALLICTAVPLAFIHRLPATSLHIPDRRARRLAAALLWGIALACAAVACAGLAISSTFTISAAALCAMVPRSLRSSCPTARAGTRPR